MIPKDKARKVIAQLESSNSGGIEYEFKPRDIKQRFDISPNILRYWEQKGELIAKRNAMGTRYYTLAQLKKLIELPLRPKRRPRRPQSARWAPLINYNIDRHATNIVYHAVCQGDIHTYHYVGTVTSQKGIISRMATHRSEALSILNNKKAIHSTVHAYLNILGDSGSGMDVLAALSNPDRWTVSSIPYMTMLPLKTAEELAKIEVARDFPNDIMLMGVARYETYAGFTERHKIEQLRDDLHKLTSSREEFENAYKYNNSPASWWHDLPTFLKRYQKAFMSDIPEIYDNAPNKEIRDILLLPNPF